MFLISINNPHKHIGKRDRVKKPPHSGAISTARAREKPPEMIFRSRKSFEENVRVVPDHLEELRMRYVKDEISEIEYNRMKSFLESDK